MTRMVEVMMFTITNMRPTPRRRQEPVTATRAYDGRSITSTHTNMLNRSPVRRAPLTPVLSIKMRGTTNR